MKIRYFNGPFNIVATLSNLPFFKTRSISKELTIGLVLLLTLVEIGSLSFFYQGQSKSHTRDLMFTIQDAGIGIPLADQKRIFDAFEQVSSQSHRIYGGTGLGLAICNKLVDAMGGKIQLESQDNTGSAFQVIIPVVDQVSEETVGKKEKIVSPGHSIDSAVHEFDSKQLKMVLKIMETEINECCKHHETMSMDELEDLGKSAKTVGGTYQYQPLINWGEHLHSEAAFFEINKIKKDLRTIFHHKTRGKRHRIGSFHIAHVDHQDPSWHSQRHI